MAIRLEKGVSETTFGVSLPVGYCRPMTRSRISWPEGRYGPKMARTGLVF